MNCNHLRNVRGKSDDTHVIRELRFVLGDRFFAIAQKFFSTLTKYYCDQIKLKVIFTP